MSRNQPALGPPGFVTARNRGGTSAPVSRSFPMTRARVESSASGVAPSPSTDTRLASSATIAWYSVERYRLTASPSAMCPQSITDASDPFPNSTFRSALKNRPPNSSTSRSIFRRCVLSSCSQFSRRINASWPGTRSERSYSHRRAPVDFPGPACPPHRIFRCAASQSGTCDGNGTNWTFRAVFGPPTCACANCRPRHGAC
jgi:hypothetical protein